MGSYTLHYKSREVGGGHSTNKRIKKKGRNLYRQISLASTGTFLLYDAGLHTSSCAVPQYLHSQDLTRHWNNTTKTQIRNEPRDLRSPAEKCFDCGLLLFTSWRLFFFLHLSISDDSTEVRESIAEFFFPPPAHNRLELPSGTSLEQEVGRLVHRSAANQREFTPKDLLSGDSLLTVNGPTAFGWSCLKGLGRNENNHSPSLTGIVSGPGSFWIQSSSWLGVLSKCYLIISFKLRAIERESLGRWGFRLWDHTRQSPLTAQDLPRATLRWNGEPLANNNSWVSQIGVRWKKV